MGSQCLGLSIFILFSPLGAFLMGCAPSVTKQSVEPGAQAVNSAPPSHVYDQPPEVVAQATIAAMSSLSWDVDYSQSTPPRLIEAATSPSLWTGGDRVQAIIGTRSDDQKTTVHVISRTAGQLYDWGKNEENIRRFFSALDGALASGYGEASGRPKFTDVLVTAGPISQPAEALGEIHANTVGMFNFNSALNDALFRSPLQRAIQGPTPVAHVETMNKILRAKARQQFGNKADAIVNVVYRNDPDGNVYASGLAVHFTEPQPPPTQATAKGPSLEERLKELKDLREKNLITSEEYYEKRNELLKGL